MGHCCGGSARNEHVLTFSVKGLTCDHCVMSVRNAVTAIHGVKSVDIDRATGKVSVNTDGSVSRDAIVTAIGDAGYEAA